MPLKTEEPETKRRLNQQYRREADIPTNGIKAVAAEPGGADEFADRGVAESLRTSLASIVVLCVHHAVGGDPR